MVGGVTGPFGVVEGVEIGARGLTQAVGPLVLPYSPVRFTLTSVV